MACGVCVLSLYAAIDRVLQIIEVAVKPIEDMWVGCLTPGLEIQKSAMQISMAPCETCKV